MCIFFKSSQYFFICKIGLLVKVSFPDRLMLRMDSGTISSSSALVLTPISKEKNLNMDAQSKKILIFVKFQDIVYVPLFKVFIRVK